MQSATELSTTVAAVVETLAHDANNVNALDDAIRLMEAFHSSDASATRFLASRNPADSDTTRVDTQAMDRSFKALQAHNVNNPRVQRFLKAMVEPTNRYEKALAGLITATNKFASVTAERNDAANALLDATNQIRYAATEQQLGTVGGMLVDDHLRAPARIYCVSIADGSGINPRVCYWPKHRAANSANYRRDATAGSRDDRCGYSFGRI